MGIRKNQKSLSSIERQRFVAAVQQMKNAGIYDQYVQWHLDAMGNMGPGDPNYAHQGPAFLPWHREFILLFEQDMQNADRSLGQDGTLTLPYWDWTSDTSSDPLINALWADDFLGPDGDSSDGQRVKSGPFATNMSAGAEKWIITVHDPMDNDPVNFLQRSLGQDRQAPTLPTSSQLADILKVATYDSSPWNTVVLGTKSFRNLLEGWVTVHPGGQAPGMHNRVHVWVGGSMLPMSSPNDPIFFLNHCNVDRIWASWQVTYPKANQFPPSNGAAQVGHNREDIMVPWDGRNDPRSGAAGTLPRLTPVDVLDINQLSYSYDELVTVQNAKQA
jgi:tyrosinase